MQKGFGLGPFFVVFLTGDDEKHQHHQDLERTSVHESEPSFVSLSHVTDKPVK